MVVVEEEKNRNVVLMDGVGGGSGMKIKIWQGAKYLKRRKVGEGGWCKENIAFSDRENNRNVVVLQGR